MIGMVVYLILLLVLVLPTDSLARRTYITPEQKAQLARIRTILVSALALGEKGPASSDNILGVVKRRFEDLSFQVVTDPEQPHDVVFHAVCEVHKPEQIVTPHGGDAELTDTPDRLWDGPACQLSYRLEGKDLGWYKEVHASVKDRPLSGREFRATDSEASVFEQLTQALEHLDFPIMLLSEWGQTSRLVALLSVPGTTPARQLLILELFRQFPASEALPELMTMIQQGRYPDEAIGALSGLGTEVVPQLRQLFGNTNQDVSIRAAAAKGLGRIMRADGDPDVIAVLLEYLANAVSRITSSADIEFPVLTEVVWAVGSMHHKPTFQLIDTLQSRIWLIYDTSPEMKKLRDVVSVTYRYMEFNQL